MTMAGSHVGHGCQAEAIERAVHERNLRDKSVALEAATGSDSIPTIERVYGSYEDDSVFVCVWPDCEYRTRDSERMWRHVHGVIGRKHPKSFTKEQING